MDKWLLLYWMQLLIYAITSKAILEITVEVRAWNYMSLFYINVIIYPYPNVDAGLANIRYQKVQTDRSQTTTKQYIVRIIPGVYSVIF